MSSTTAAEEVYAKLEAAGVMAVLMIDHAADAAPLAETLLEGGIRAMELTLRTDAAIDSLRAIKKAVPEMLVGIGTVLTPEQVKQVSGEGAAFAVSPGMNPRVAQAAVDCGLPFAPGIVTPSDVEAALEFGFRRLKFFPAEVSGGLAYLRNIAAPYNHLGVKYIPLGGVNQANLAEYLSEPLVAAVGGSWLAPKQAIAEGNWAHIRTLAEAASKTVAEVRSP
ncbi:MAG: bifunctional 4-hydroxy-2-oxoglutarate aldolase/2-dehydro-3-deoxy-phosphogluconate aldolase [Planctomycetes bacterium]|nr:bifunctional 4-hydroxy-2-oxoglutarate aldolase/2-dehydro-3-deoxy-phosphogluconate aldolase [Planctomycetota bacterium]